MTIEKEPTKIVSLAPNNTEVLFALGWEIKVIGVTSYCDYPEEAKTKEVVGDFSGNNLEKNSGVKSRFSFNLWCWKWI